MLQYIPLLTGVLEKIFPDKAKADEAKLKMMELVQNGELAVLSAEVKIAEGQLRINEEEAKAGPFRGGWRPFIGWVCGSAFALNFLIFPFAEMVMTIVGSPMTFTRLDMTEMMPVLLGLLGLGGLRTYERVKGKA